MKKDQRTKRDIHALNKDGMVLCNPRDKEAAHRTQMGDITIEGAERVTCQKCLTLLHRNKERR
jgi:hypothetical protein